MNVFVLQLCDFFFNKWNFWAQFCRGHYLKTWNTTLKLNCCGVTRTPNQSGTWSLAEGNRDATKVYSVQGTCIYEQVGDLIQIKSYTKDAILDTETAFQSPSSETWPTFKIKHQDYCFVQIAFTVKHPFTTIKYDLTASKQNYRWLLTCDSITKRITSTLGFLQLLRAEANI